MSNAHRSLLALVALAIVGLLATWAIASTGGESERRTLPDGAQQAAEELSVDASSAQVLRTLEAPAGELRWTLVSYDSSEGLCRDWIAEEIGGTAQGMLGGCGGDAADEFSWSVDGIELGGQWYNVINGTGGDEASQVNVTLNDGTSRSAGITNDAWLIVVPGPDPLQGSKFDVDRIEALSPTRSVLESVRPPSVQTVYEQYENELKRPPTITRPPVEVPGGRGCVSCRAFTGLPWQNPRRLATREIWR